MTLPDTETPATKAPLTPAEYRTSIQTLADILNAVRSIPVDKLQTTIEMVDRMQVDPVLYMSVDGETIDVAELNAQVASHRDLTEAADTVLYAVDRIRARGLRRVLAPRSSN